MVQIEDNSSSSNNDVDNGVKKHKGSESRNRKKNKSKPTKIVEKTIEKSKNKIRKSSEGLLSENVSETTNKTIISNDLDALNLPTINSNDTDNSGRKKSAISTIVANSSGVGGGGVIRSTSIVMTPSNKLAEASRSRRGSSGSFHCRIHVRQQRCSVDPVCNIMNYDDSGTCSDGLESEIVSQVDGTQQPSELKFQSVNNIEACSDGLSDSEHSKQHRTDDNRTSICTISTASTITSNENPTITTPRNPSINGISESFAGSSHLSSLLSSTSSISTFTTKPPNWKEQKYEWYNSFVDDDDASKTTANSEVRPMMILPSIYKRQEPDFHDSNETFLPDDSNNNNDTSITSAQDGPSEYSNEEDNDDEVISINPKSSGHNRNTFATSTDCSNHSSSSSNSISRRHPSHLPTALGRSQSNGSTRSRSNSTGSSSSSNTSKNIKRNSLHSTSTTNSSAKSMASWIRERRHRLSSTPSLSPHDTKQKKQQQSPHSSMPEKTPSNHLINKTSNSMGNNNDNNSNKDRIFSVGSTCHSEYGESSESSSLHSTSSFENMGDDLYDDYDDENKVENDFAVVFDMEVNVNDDFNLNDHDNHVVIDENERNRNSLDDNFHHLVSDHPGRLRNDNTNNNSSSDNKNVPQQEENSCDSSRSCHERFDKKITKSFESSKQQYQQQQHQQVEISTSRERMDQSQRKEKQHQNINDENNKNNIKNASTQKGQLQQQKQKQQSTLDSSTVETPLPQENVHNITEINGFHNDNCIKRKNKTNNCKSTCQNDQSESNNSREKRQSTSSKHKYHKQEKQKKSTIVSESVIVGASRYKSSESVEKINKDADMVNNAKTSAFAFTSDLTVPDGANNKAITIDKCTSTNQKNEQLQYSSDDQHQEKYQNFTDAQSTLKTSDEIQKSTLDSFEKIHPPKQENFRKLSTTTLKVSTSSSGDGGSDETSNIILPTPLPVGQQGSHRRGSRSKSPKKTPVGSKVCDSESLKDPNDIKRKGKSKGQNHQTQRLENNCVVIDTPTVPQVPIEAACETSSTSATNVISMSPLHIPRSMSEVESHRLEGNMNDLQHKQQQLENLKKAKRVDSTLLDVINEDEGLKAESKHQQQQPQQQQQQQKDGRIPSETSDTCNKSVETHRRERRNAKDVKPKTPTRQKSIHAIESSTTNRRSRSHTPTDTKRQRHTTKKSGTRDSTSQHQNHNYKNKGDERENMDANRPESQQQNVSKIVNDNETGSSTQQVTLKDTTSTRNHHSRSNKSKSRCAEKKDVTENMNNDAIMEGNEQQQQHEQQQQQLNKPQATSEMNQDRSKKSSRSRPSAQQQGREHKNLTPQDTPSVSTRNDNSKAQISRRNKEPRGTQNVETCAQGNSLLSIPSSKSLLYLQEDASNEKTSSHNLSIRKSRSQGPEHRYLASQLPIVLSNSSYHGNLVHDTSTKLIPENLKSNLTDVEIPSCCHQPLQNEQVTCNDQTETSSSTIENIIVVQSPNQIQTTIQKHSKELRHNNNDANVVSVLPSIQNIESGSHPGFDSTRCPEKHKEWLETVKRLRKGVTATTNTASNPHIDGEDDSEFGTSDPLFLKSNVKSLEKNENLKNSEQVKDTTSSTDILDTKIDDNKFSPSCVEMLNGIPVLKHNSKDDKDNSSPSFKTNLDASDGLHETDREIECDNSLCSAQPSVQTVAQKFINVWTPNTYKSKFEVDSPRKTPVSCLSKRQSSARQPTKSETSIGILPLSCKVTDGSTVDFGFNRVNNNSRVWPSPRSSYTENDKQFSKADLLHHHMNESITVASVDLEGLTGEQQAWRGIDRVLNNNRKKNDFDPDDQTASICTRDLLPEAIVQAMIQFNESQSVVSAVPYVFEQEEGDSPDRIPKASWNFKHALDKLDNDCTSSLPSLIDNDDTMTIQSTDTKSVCSFLSYLTTRNNTILQEDQDDENRQVALHEFLSGVLSSFAPQETRKGTEEVDRADEILRHQLSCADPNLIVQLLDLLAPQIDAMAKLDESYAYKSCSKKPDVIDQHHTLNQNQPVKSQAPYSERTWTGNDEDVAEIRRLETCHRFHNSTQTGHPLTQIVEMEHTLINHNIRVDRDRQSLSWPRSSSHSMPSLLTLATNDVATTVSPSSENEHDSLACSDALTNENEYNNDLNNQYQRLEERADKKQIFNTEQYLVSTVTTEKGPKEHHTPNIYGSSSKVLNKSNSKNTTTDVLLKKKATKKQNPVKRKLVSDNTKKNCTKEDESIDQPPSTPGLLKEYFKSPGQDPSTPKANNKKPSVVQKFGLPIISSLKSVETDIPSSNNSSSWYDQQEMKRRIYDTKKSFWSLKNISMIPRVGKKLVGWHGSSSTLSVSSSIQGRGDARFFPDNDDVIEHETVGALLSST